MGEYKDTNDEKDEIKDFRNPEHEKAKPEPKRDGSGRIIPDSITGNPGMDEDLENDAGGHRRNNMGDKSGR